MAFPIGLPSEEQPDGTWVGTTPQGIQRVIGSMYQNSGILPGNRTKYKVEGTTSWAYRVPSLTAFMWTSYASRLGVLVPIDEETIPISAPVGGATRTDTIYCDLDGVVKVAEGATAAPEGVEIDRVVIPAGATNTQGITSNWDTRYAIPAGASLGMLAKYEFPNNTRPPTPGGSDHVVYTKRFTVPTDRLVRIEMGVTLESVSSAGGRGAIGIEIDGTYRKALHASYDGRNETNAGVWTTEVSEGAHTFTVFIRHFDGVPFKTLASASASEVTLWDAGVAQ